MAVTTTKTTHGSVSTLLNVRPQFERTKSEYGNSFGTFVRSIGPYKLWHVVNEISDTFNNDVHPQLRSHLNEKRSSIRPPRNYRGPREPRNALRCYMVGLTQDRASPHVAILCKEKWFCTQARHIILESGLLQDRGWVGCIKLPYEIRQNGVTSPQVVPIKTFDAPEFSKYPSYAERNQHNVAISCSEEGTETLCGRRIAVPGVNGYVRMATLGGIIEINRELFGLSVSHAFSAEVLSYDETESGAERDTESFDLDQDDLDPFVRTMEHHQDLLGASESSAEPTKASEVEDISLSSSTEADDDVADSLVGWRDKNELARWSLGSRETFGKKASYEFEWALISIDDDSSTRYDSLTNDAKTNSDEKLSVTSVASEKASAGTHLLLQTPRGRLVVIAISAESSVQLNSGNEQRRLWTVQVDQIEDGDCGSWVVDPVTGHLFGMLVATCKALREAYILPVKDIFTEIQTVSGRSVRLPFLKSSPKKTELISPEESSSLYLPLRADEIRMLTLLPGKWQAPIDCKLSIHSLDSSPGYEIVSYVWNREKLTTSINVNGQSIWVDSNLASALTDLRHTGHPRPLWIDALCIKQEDNEEKNDQLSLLASIMARASNVCLWLGSEDGRFRRVFSSYGSTLNLDEPKDSDNRYLIKEEAADAFSGLVKRARFHLGNVQAMCLARNATVHCGQDTIPWKAFVDTVAIIYHSYDPNTPEASSSYHRLRGPHVRDVHADLTVLYKLVDSISNSIRWLDNGQIERKLSLGALVVLFSFIEPKTHHDAIYSMVPLAKDVFPSSKSSITSSPKVSLNESRTLQSINKLTHTPNVLEDEETSLRPVQRRALFVDYSQPFEHLCKDFVQLVVRDSQSLDILCLPWAPLSAKYPSWVSQSSLVSHAYIGIRQSPKYDASKLTSPKFHMSINSINSMTTPNISISVKGFVLDTVRVKTSFSLMGNISPDWIDFLEWENVNTPPPEKVWRTLVGDRELYSTCPPPISYRPACQRAFRQVNPKHGLEIRQEVHRGDSLTRGFLKHVEQVVWGRRLIKTERHDFLGLAPGATKKRDIVAILYGLSVPVVLRQVQGNEEGDPVYKLVGECFVYGMMDGEAMDLRKAQGIQDQTFVLE